MSRLALLVALAPLFTVVAFAETPAIESGFIEVPGGRIYYEAAGQGPAVVMIHDGLLHSATWDAPFAALAKEYRVIRWDRRGYGKSPAATEPYAIVEDVAAVLKRNRVERATLMGCSVGGMITVHFALEHPEMVRALVLVGPIVSGFGFSDHFNTRGGRGKPPEDAPVEQRIDYYTGRDPWLLAPESVAARAKVKALLLASPQDLKVDWDLVRWPKTTALGRLGEIKVPTLLISGESDIPDVQAHIGALQAGIAGARRVVLAHSGHLPQIETPEAFDREVLEFLHMVK